MNLDQDIHLIPQPRAQELLGVSAMTLWRWQKEAAFPKAKTIRGRKYFQAVDIQSWIDKQQSDDIRDIPKADEGRAKGRAEHRSNKIAAA